MSSSLSAQTSAASSQPFSASPSSSVSLSALSRQGEDLFRTKTDKINADLFILTYGSLVTQLLRDYEDPLAVNAALDKLGHSIGCRLIEEHLARVSSLSTSNGGKCPTFADVGEHIARLGFRTFLNISPTVLHKPTEPAPPPGGVHPERQSPEFVLQLDANPLAEYVQLPPEVKAGPLWYSNILCGVIRGALEMVHLQTKVHFLSDQLKGHDRTQIRVVLVKRLQESGPAEDDD